jgi:VanZ family protein
VHPRRPSPTDSHELQPWRRRAAAAGWALLLAALLAYLALGEPPDLTLFWDAFFDAGHTPLFGFVALAILGLLRTRRPHSEGSSTWWQAFALTAALGAVTEILQFFQPSRDPSVEDFLRDVAGSGAWLLITAAAWPGRSGAAPVRTLRGRVTAVTVAVLLVLVAGAHLATTAVLYVERNRARPTLFALDGSWWEQRLVHEHDSVLTPHTGPPRLEASFHEPLARLDLKPGTYPGVAFDEPYPDWSGYRRLAFTVVSDLDAPLALSIRIHDAAHDQRYRDRFNRQLVISRGVNRIVIPVDDIRFAPDRREMDMQQIRGIIVFGYRLRTATHVYVSALRLE